MKLLTRSDFDGLVCAVLLEEAGIVNEYQFVHPKDVQDGTVKVNSNDVLANIPYVHGCGLWFDHHLSEVERVDLFHLKYEGASRPAPSAAQVIWEYYGGEERFGPHLLPLLEAVNKSDSGNLTIEEILNPEGFILLSFIMDPRTGLGRYKDYRISNYQLMEDLIKYCRKMDVDEIMANPDVVERVNRFNEHRGPFEAMIRDCCTISDNVIVTNLLEQEQIYCGSRFLIYALYPDQNIEIRVQWGKNKQNISFSCGHSIVNRSSNTNVAKLMLQYGGGGHLQVGTCQTTIDYWEEVLEELVEQMRKDG